MSSRLTATARREQLLEVALDVFARAGYHATSMNEVAEAAGVTKPVLYQHFSSKRELYLELLRDVGDRLMAAIGKATAEAGTPHKQVERGFQAYFKFVAEERDAFVLLFGSGARRDEEFSAAVKSVERTIAEAIAVLIDADIDADHRRNLAFGLVGLAEGTSRHWVDQVLDLDPDRLAKQVADLAWAGLRGIHRIDA
jgi:AcrR family transcriptional regulator